MALGICGCLLLFPAFGFSISDSPELTSEQMRQASSITANTLSPFCPGATLAMCTSRQASTWRADIRTWVAEEVSSEEILSRLQARVPEFQLSAQPNSPLFYIGLAALVLVSVAFLIMAGLRLRPSIPVHASSESEVGANKTSVEYGQLMKELADVE